MLPLPTPGDPPDPGVKSTSPASADGFFTTEPAGKPVKMMLLEAKTGHPWAAHDPKGQEVTSRSWWVPPLDGGGAGYT